MKLAAWIVGGFLAAGLIAALYVDAFRTIVVEETQCGPFELVYRLAEGTDMRNIGAITDEIDALLASRGIDRHYPLQVYHPDGRTEVGLVVGDISDVHGLPPDDTMLRIVPAHGCMRATFPWRNPLSFAVGYYKVDPALAAHRMANGYRVAEAMTLLMDGDIVYMQSIIHADRSENLR